MPPTPTELPDRQPRVATDLPPVRLDNHRQMWEKVKRQLIRSLRIHETASVLV